MSNPKKTKWRHEWEKANLKWEDPNQYLDRVLQEVVRRAVNDEGVPPLFRLGTATFHKAFGYKDLLHRDILIRAVSENLLKHGIFENKQEFEFIDHDGVVELSTKLPRSIGAVRNRSALNRRVQAGYDYALSGSRFKSEKIDTYPTSKRNPATSTTAKRLDTSVSAVVPA